MYTNSRDKGIFKHINRNIVHPTLNSKQPDSNKVTTSVEIVELNSDGEEINLEYNNNNNSKAVFDTNNESYKKHYEENKEARDKISMETGTYYDYIYKDRSNYSTNLIDIFTDLYSEICCDMDDNVSFKNIKYSKTINNNISSNSSEDESILSEGSYRYQSHNNWSHYKKLFDGNGQTESFNYTFDEYYFSEYNVDLCNQSTSKSTIEEKDRENDNNNDNYSISRIPTPITVNIPRLDMTLMPALPTVREVAEPNSTLLPLPLKNTGNNKSHTNSWMGTNVSCNILTLKETPERYFSWIPLVVRKEKYMTKTKKTKPKKEIKVTDKDKFINKISRNYKVDSQKTVLLENDLNNDIVIGNNGQKDKQIDLDYQKIDVIESLNIGIDSVEAKDNKPIEVENFDVKLNDCLELADCNISDKAAIELLNESAKSNTALPTASIPSLHSAVVADTDESRPWFRKVIQYFRCCK